MRFAITVAVEWRFVLAVVILVLVLLMKKPTPGRAHIPAGTN